MSHFFASPGIFISGPWRVVRYIDGILHAYPGGGSEQAAWREAEALNNDEQQQAELYAAGEILQAKAFA